MERTSISVGLNAVILAVTEETPRVLTVDAEGAANAALPFGPLDPAGDRTLELGLRRWVHERAGLSVGYVEQLYTFGDRDRQTATLDADTRVLSIAYLALTRQDEAHSDLPGRWRDIYEFLPWEDWREGAPTAMKQVLPALESWAESDPARRESRRERLQINFALGGARWDGDRALERYELAWEAGLVAESPRAASSEAGLVGLAPLGRAMAHDHRRILATALGRVRGKIKYRPVVFELLDDEFTLLRLQRVVEALAGVTLHKQNFRRLVDRLGLVEGCGRFDEHTGGRPAELFRFRREVVRERRKPGVGLPQVRQPVG
jgi:hypothetical protein